MSSRTQSTNSRPRSSAPTSQEKDEGKEARQDPIGVSSGGASEAGTEDGVNSKVAGGVNSPAKDSGSPSSPSAGVTDNGKNRANATPASPAGATSNGTKPGSAAAEENGDMAALKGKKVLKTLGPNKVVEGYVDSYIPAKESQEEKWLLKWDDQGDEEVTKAELDKWINLHNVRIWSKGAKKRDRAPRTPSSPTKRVPKRRQKENSPSPSIAKRSRSRSPRDSGASSPKTRSSTSSSSLRSVSKKAKVSSPSGTGRKSGRLNGDASDVGKLVAKEFTEGVFTGEVTKVKQGSLTLWSIRYEDDDAEDLDESEMASPVKLYDTLLAKFEAASGRAVTPADEEAEKGDDGSGSQKTPKKGKGKGKGKAKKDKGESAEGDNSTHVGARVRKFFQKYGEFDGKVAKHSSANEKDDLGNLWLVKYDDGDSEHMNEKELLDARALYDKHYALERKEIDLQSKETSAGKKATNIPKATNCVLYAERPKGSRLFSKIKNYRRWKETS